MARFPARRHRVNRGFALLSMTAFLVAGGVLAYVLNMRAPRPQITGHARIIDGDSLMVAGTEVRLWGIDAPELFQRCMRDGREVQCGREAARALIAMVAGQQVTCDRRDMDRFGRTVATCRVEAVDLAQAMVSAGHAVSFGGYYSEEAQARAGRRGLWAGEFMRPREWRDRGRPHPGA
ncbi:MAG: thermonuclease family protein [Proteobacteria bacterium]|nr:thermonuclease family protein [Pseudomonadota bacterium]